MSIIRFFTEKIVKIEIDNIHLRIYCNCILYADY